MILSNSTWDRKEIKKPKSPPFIKGLARVSYEFDNRKTPKIFSHSLGRVEFNNTLGKDLSEGRNEQINNVYGESSVDGYKYKSVSHTYVLPQLIDSDLTILGHGFPVSGGWENCKMINTVCREGDSDTKCLSGKCKIGSLTRVSGDKWRYDSFTVPNLYYYVFGREQVTLKSVTKGRFKLPAGAGVVNIPRVASIPATIYLPPNTYSEETFTRRVIIKYNTDNGAVNSLTDSVDNFIRSTIGLNQVTVKVEKELYDRVLDYLRSVLDKAWYGFIDAVINGVWGNRLPNMTNKEFLIDCYQALTVLYRSGVEIMMSGIKPSGVKVDQGIGRPVYGRLPGVEGKYNNPDDPDTPSKWLTSGSDSFLSEKKHNLDTFFRDYLDPDTCYPLNLDWIAQHMGFMGGMWDIEWSNQTKRLLLRNAHSNRLSGSIWVQSAELDTLRRIDMGRIETAVIDTNTGEVTTGFRYTERKFNIADNIINLDTFNDLSVYISNWDGIIPSRGSLLTLIVMFWAFGIKAHSPEELTFDGMFRVRSGLRDKESTAPINTPYIVDVLRVGDNTDAEISNYPNQLISDVGTCQDELSANTTIIRMPFYYNRNGRSWDTVNTIMENYSPSTTIHRIQYAYSAADLLVADDTFFEPIVL